MSKTHSYKGFQIASFLVLYFSYVQSECNVCSPSTGLACVSGNQFKVCVGGMPTGNINSCPSGTICSSTGSICQAPAPNQIEECQDCNKCDATNTFACTGPSTYVLCLGTATPSQLAGTCQPDYLCNRNNRFICEDSKVGGVATCPSAITPTMAPATTKPEPILDPIHFCKSTQQNGRFPVHAPEPELACKHYFYCFVRGGVWRGQLYKCPGETYFNRASRYCDSNIPAVCV